MSRFSRSALVAVLATAATAAVVPSLSRAGDPAATPAAAPVVSPRLAAVEGEVRALEHLLALLRRTRNELRAGREVTTLTSEAAEARDAALRAVREVLRYEAARTKATAALAAAVEAKDEAKVAAAKEAVDAADRRLADVWAQLESDAAARPETGKTDAGKADATGKGTKPPEVEKPARRADTPSSMGAAEADED
jgi:colicin import membrane protein